MDFECVVMICLKVLFRNSPEQLEENTRTLSEDSNPAEMLHVNSYQFV
jgi:hypothetical protein